MNYNILKKPEVLAPAGNFEKLKAALLYGADAVYLAGNMFGMRSAADNFTIEELYAASEYVHARGKKLYDKRETSAKRDADRTIEKAMKNKF
jgi:collagenase-like PrtC family protease